LPNSMYICEAKLDLSIGDGYLVDNAANDLRPYNINIQQGWPDTTLIVPIDLNLDAG
jgi:hypothetical protein